MSMFFCTRCDQMRDSDDGAEELHGELVCASCADDAACEAEDAAVFMPTDEPSAAPFAILADGISARVR